VFRLVPEAGADRAAIAQRITSWAGGVSVEFVALSELKLVGARQKLRHLVVPEDAGAGKF
jgi:phenylacetate-CoA ligase